MDEAVFNALAEAELARIEAALEGLGLDIDIEPKSGGVLEITCENDSRVIINRHGAAREIWVAARSGGYHFAPGEQGWIAGRDGAELYATLSRVLSEQCGASVTLEPGT